MPWTYRKAEVYGNQVVEFLTLRRDCVAQIKLSRGPARAFIDFERRGVRGFVRSAAPQPQVSFIADFRERTLPEVEPVGAGSWALGSADAIRWLVIDSHVVSGRCPCLVFQVECGDQVPVGVVGYGALIAALDELGWRNVHEGSAGKVHARKGGLRAVFAFAHAGDLGEGPRVGFGRLVMGVEAGIDVACYASGVVDLFRQYRRHPDPSKVVSGFGGPPTSKVLKMRRTGGTEKHPVYIVRFEGTEWEPAWTWETSNPNALVEPYLGIADGWGLIGAANVEWKLGTGNWGQI
jgi:hypothetical protein